MKKTCKRIINWLIFLILVAIAAGSIFLLIRYYYEKFIIKQRKKGYAFRQTDTAWETGEKLKQQGRISQAAVDLFSRYNEARYNIHAEITSEDVEKAKKIYRNPHV